MELCTVRLKKRAKTALDRKTVRQLERIVSWADARGLTINLTSTYSYQLGRDINVKNTSSLRTILFSLLHELGHYLVGDTNERFFRGYHSAGTPSVRKLFTHRVAVLDEELEAWERGWKLAKRLNVKLDRRAFERQRARWIVTYCKFVVDKNMKLADYGT